MFRVLLTLPFVTCMHSIFADEIVLKTPRGAEVNVIRHIPAGTNLPVIVVGPGQSCNSRNAIFESLGQMGFDNGVAVIRFEWSYCNSHPAQPTPSDDLINEIEDYQTVLEHVRSLPSIDKTKITIAGKSLGSVVAYWVFARETKVKTLALLTPVCSYVTDENGKPLKEPLAVGDENYPRIKEDTRPILMTMGNSDSLCLIPVLNDFLKDAKTNISTFIAEGDHGFRVKDAAGKVDQAKTDANISAVMDAVLKWKSAND